MKGITRCKVAVIFESANPVKPEVASSYSFHFYGLEGAREAQNKKVIKSPFAFLLFLP
jgi:hypothetical protein